LSPGPSVPYLRQDVCRPSRTVGPWNANNASWWTSRHASSWMRAPADGGWPRCVPATFRFGPLGCPGQAANSLFGAWGQRTLLFSRSLALHVAEPGSRQYVAWVFVCRKLPCAPCFKQQRCHFICRATSNTPVYPSTPSRGRAWPPLTGTLATDRVGSPSCSVGCM
jgi:hypothetical protein